MLVKIAEIKREITIQLLQLLSVRAVSGLSSKILDARSPDSVFFIITQFSLNFFGKIMGEIFAGNDRRELPW